MQAKSFVVIRRVESDKQKSFAVIRRVGLDKQKSGANFDGIIGVYG